MRGATAAKSRKPATLETGLVVQVPAFVKQGDRVRIDTASGAYIERAGR
jgi:elongation factor P